MEDNNVVTHLVKVLHAQVRYILAPRRIYLRAQYFPLAAILQYIKSFITLKTFKSRISIFNVINVQPLIYKYKFHYPSLKFYNMINFRYSDIVYEMEESSSANAHHKFIFNP